MPTSNHGGKWTVSTQTLSSVLDGHGYHILKFGLSFTSTSTLKLKTKYISSLESKLELYEKKETVTKTKMRLLG